MLVITTAAQRREGGVLTGELQSEIHCCVEDQTDLEEAREGEQQLQHKAEAVERLRSAREMRDMVSEPCWAASLFS